VDRLGYPYSPLERGEIDQGQYDRVREVFYVSSIAMLLSRRALERVGPPDERFVSQLEDLDLCWRVRVAGFRVLWTPQATALRRRVRSQSVRAVRDREVRQLMAPGWIRPGRWARTVSEAARPAREDEPEAKPVTPGVRLRRLAAAHPVVVAWILAGVLALIA